MWDSRSPFVPSCNSCPKEFHQRTHSFYLARQKYKMHCIWKLLTCSSTILSFFEKVLKKTEQQNMKLIMYSCTEMKRKLATEHNVPLHSLLLTSLSSLHPAPQKNNLCTCMELVRAERSQRERKRGEGRYYEIVSIVSREYQDNCKIYGFSTPAIMDAGEDKQDTNFLAHAPLPKNELRL